MNLPITRFWMIRHALVDPAAQGVLYGTLDVPLCETTLAADASRYAVLAARLPARATWIVTPLSRTQKTAAALFEAGYEPADLIVEPGLVEQDFGAWQGRPLAEFAGRDGAHPFWPLGGSHTPPEGESFETLQCRVGETIERLAADHRGRDVVIVAHGGSIRAATAHALDLAPDQALNLSIDNISLTRLERHPRAWRVVSVNEAPVA